MKALLLLLGVLYAGCAWGWGMTHNSIARLCSQYMPPQVREFLGEWNNQLEQWCHYPDMQVVDGKRRFLDQGDMRRELGDDAELFIKWGFNKGDWLHRHTGRAVSFANLQRAFNEGKPKLAAFCISELSHALSDQGALNHSPILQFTTYSDFKGVDYGWKHEGEFTFSNGAVTEAINRRLGQYRAKVLATNCTEAMYEVVMDCYRQSEIAAEEEVRFAFGTKSEHNEAMTRTIAAQVEAIIDTVQTAWTLRGEKFEMTQALLEGIKVREETRRRRGDARTQAVYNGIFDSALNPAKPKATIGIVCEPFGSFHVRVLSYVGKMLTAAAARTLRDNGYALRGISFWEIEKSALPSPEEVPVIMLATGECTGMSKAQVAAFKKYRAAGGRLFVMGGSDPCNLTDLRDILEKRTNAEVPVSSKWALAEVGDWQGMRLEMTSAMKETGRGPFAFVRNPNFNGFCKPCCMWSMKDTLAVRALARLVHGSKSFTIGGIARGVCWMPEYLFLPFLFSQDKTVDWREVRLDSFSSKVLVDAMACLLEAPQIPLPEHPRPDWERKDWLNLNGEWNFSFDQKDKGIAEKWFTAGDEKFAQKIIVPFAWGSKLSGLNNEADIGWYRRRITVPQAWKGKRVFLVVGASDHDTACWIGGVKLGEHSGGYTPFEFELTDSVKWGEAQAITLRAWDSPNPRDHRLYGKQGYGNARGIWQTVYLEARANEFLDAVHFTPDIDEGTVTAAVSLGAPAKEPLTFEIHFNQSDRSRPAMASFKPGQMSAKIKIALDRVKLWELDNPYLYEVKCTLSTAKARDEVRTYFGMRKVGVGKMPGTENPYVTLNGKPIYMQLTLDQSYHPDGFYTFPSDEFMKNEILISKKLALGGNRVHIKVEVPRKLYWADKLGLLIMADVPCAWGYASEAMFREHWCCFEDMVKRDFNHPSIFSWVLFNETWGLFSGTDEYDAKRKRMKRVFAPWTQRAVAKAYAKAKALDPTRLIEDNSPCNRDHVVTDINTWHAYEPGYRWEARVAKECADTFPGSKENYIGGFVQGKAPMFNSECGNVWGYNGSTGDCDWSWDYHLMINAFRRNLKCAGWLYTEHHDVINEWNGYVRFDRTPKYTGIDELTDGAMSLKDLHAAAYLPLDKELCRVFKAGETWAMPVDASFVTGKYAGKELKLFCKLIYHDARGRIHRREAQSVHAFTAAAWQTGRIVDVPVKLPDETACGVILFYLVEGDAKRAFAHNFACFVTRGPDDKNSLTAKPHEFAKAKWSQKQWNVLGGLKTCGAGKGYFEYSFTKVPAGETAKFRAEISAKRLNSKDADGIDKGVRDLDCMLGGGFVDRSKNPNSYPMTSDEKWPSQVKVIVNDVCVKTVELPDDPADHRGILSWASQPRKGNLHEAGSYGYLVEAEIPAEVLAKGDGKVVVRLETEKGGLAVYGAKFGRFPFDPTLEF